MYRSIPPCCAGRESALGRESADLQEKFPKLGEWEAGETYPTLKQAEKFAHAMHVPLGYLFMQEPPDESLPIQDFRTIAGRPVQRPSPNLLDMLYMAQERQAWYRDFALMTHESKVGFVDSLTNRTPVTEAAETMAKVLSFNLEDRATCPTWENALRQFIEQAERIGVLVMVSGVVLSNTRRPLDVEEFRGFALADAYAPLVFINGADTRAGQMFTLAHELAHLWLGVSALSNVTSASINGHRHRREEVWCNAVAAELLAPLAVVRANLQPGEAPNDRLQRLARHFKVSTLVILRRLLDAEVLERDEFDVAWENERNRLLEHTRKKRGKASGGNFYHTTLARASHRFARALIESTLEGHTLYRDAFRMLGVSKTETFNTIGQNLGLLP